MIRTPAGLKAPIELWTIDRKYMYLQLAKQIFLFKKLAVHLPQKCNKFHKLDIITIRCIQQEENVLPAEEFILRVAQ